ncbi:S8 family serine peptidase, partial [bacterium]|nr:S8 family serine peptidase [bacterium]
GSRIANPAQSFFALTVGSVSGEVYNNKELGISSIEKNFNSISSFSRSGWGLWGSVKPEVVEIGGGLAIDESNNVRSIEETSIDLIRKSPEGPSHAKDEVGTSYSTPIVSNLAAMIQKEFPKCSPLLYKTLIVHSAQWPDFINPDNLDNEQMLNVIRSYGYGIPNKNKALQNNPYKITFITNGSMKLNSQDARIHYIPIPESIRSPEYSKDIKITVTLCYTSKPRRTRLYKRGYLSTWLDWISIKKDELPEDFEDRIFDRDKNDNKNFKWMIDNNPQWGQIKGLKRSDSATQKDWTYLKSYELEKYFAIAVRSHKGWDNDPYSVANYSLAVTIEAINNDIPIYSEISNAVKLDIEAETQIENELKL